MAKHSSRVFWLSLIVSLGLFFVGAPFPAEGKDPLTLLQMKGASKAREKSEKELPEIPADADRDRINSIVAGLSDDQVRRLLLKELEKSGAAAAGKRQKEEVDGVGAIVKRAEENVILFHQRLSELRAGAVAVPEFLPQTYSNLRGKGGTGDTLRMFAAILILLIGGLAAEWLFGRYAAGMRNRLATSPPAHWTVKIKRQVVCAAIEILSILVFCVATLTLFFLFFNRGQFARLVLLTYLAAVLVVRGTRLALRFLLAPGIPELRVLPVRERTARSIHRWVMGIVLASGAGFLLRALLELQGITQESILFIRATTAGIVFFMLACLVFDNREAVTGFIHHRSGDHSAGDRLFRGQLAQFWHLLAIPYFVVVWALWMFYLLVGRADLVTPILALISSLPIFVILDRLGQKLLSAIFGLVDKMEAGEQEPEPGATATAAADEEKPPEAAGREGRAVAYHVGRLVPVVRRCLSLSIAGVIVFWVLHLWGLEVRFGEAVTAAALKVLLVISLAYVAWRLIEGAINRRLKTVQTDFPVDDDSDSGGKGGSRIGTLLQLLRKFLLVVLVLTVGLIVLSAIGIDISPLLAGAGIVGLAVGLGTQNLIKDIVSGLFFLIDDAFRIGDYVESGKAKGTVEAISIRSLKLRATRGMVHNVPFSQLGMVTNFSRDYIISKLDVPVPHSTDIDRVRKVVKKINKEIEKDEELGPALLSPIKSAGVRGVSDSALNMRIKFKSKPGMEFLIQRQVLRRLQELFAEQGLEFATRHVMVRLPEDASARKGSGKDQSKEGGESSPRKDVLSAAAGAAIAAVLAEEEIAKKKLEAEAESES